MMRRRVRRRIGSRLSLCYGFMSFTCCDWRIGVGWWSLRCVYDFGGSGYGSWVLGMVCEG